MIIAVLNKNQSTKFPDMVDLVVEGSTFGRSVWGSVHIDLFSDEWGAGSPEYVALKNGEEVPFEMKARV